MPSRAGVSPNLGDAGRRAFGYKWGTMRWNPTVAHSAPPLLVRGQPTRPLAELIAAQAQAALGRTGAPLGAVEQVGTLIEADRIVSRQVVRRTRPGGLCVATTLPTGTHTLRYDAGGAWVQAPGQPRAQPLAGEAERALWRAAQWPGPALTLADFQARGHGVALLGMAAKTGSPHYVLRLRLSDGAARDYALDARTHLLRRACDVGALPHAELREWRWEDYRAVVGRWLPFGEEERRLPDGRVLRTWQWRSVSFTPLGE